MGIQHSNQLWQMGLKYGYIVGTGQFFFELSIYEYDPEGLRTKKTDASNTTRYHYDDNGLVIAETDALDQVKAQIIWGHQALARKVNGAYYYYLYNGHGDVVQVVNDAGNIVTIYTYDEWGNILSKSEQIENPIRYAGEYYDEESGLYYLRARYYDSSIGRFISKDSYEGTLTNPLSFNGYTYGLNNPLKYIDPSGFIIVEQANEQISYWKSVWWTAKASNDEELMDQAHSAAEEIRDKIGRNSYQQKFI